MSKRVTLSLVLIGLTALLFMGCQRKAVIEGGIGEESNTGMSLLDDQKGSDQDQIEASLETKTYPGIDGEVFESSMLQDIHFAFDQYALSPKAMKILAGNAEVFRKFPGAKFQIEGHCDERGTSDYNLALGERRAMSARRYLVSLGIQLDHLSTISYGEEMPADPRHNETAWTKNRRAHFVILSR